jgi:hypothetical protein
MALTQVNTDGVKDDAVTLAKQAAGIDGKIITYDANGHPVAVGPGTDGQVLTSTGAGSPPAFEDIPAKAALTGSTNNTITTVTGANAIQGEANLTFDGSTLEVTGKVGIGNDASYASGDADDLIIGATSGSANHGLTILSPTNKNGGIYFSDGDNPNGAHRGYFDYNHTTDALNIGTAGSQKVVINSAGSISVPSGQGIDFSATADGPTMASELLDDYEEGTFTPVVRAYFGGAWQDSGFDTSPNEATGTYTKVGNVVTITGRIRGFDVNSDSAGSYAGFGGLPFTAKSGTLYPVIATFYNSAMADGHAGFYIGSSSNLAYTARSDSAAGHTTWNSGSSLEFWFYGTYYA